MTKNLWERDRRRIFKKYLREYLNEGYDRNEAGIMAKREVDDVMSDQENFVKTLWNNQDE
jgi:hypothetical protein|tara:strand:- start:2895 stop:3074 length:180 start_codon:yes stop_codon:yes gene_type:complete